MQMMIINLINMLKVSVGEISTLAFGCHQFAVNNFIGDVVKTVSLERLFSNFSALIDKILSIVNAWIYFIAKLIFQFIDFIQYLVYKIAGISLSNEITFDLPMFRLLLSGPILRIFLMLFIFGLMIVIILAILAIIKSEYKNATGGNKDGKIVNSAAGAGKKALMSVFLMVFLPFLIIAGIAFSSVFLSSINSALNANGTSSTTLGGQIFIASSYNANKYRLYAESGERIPILYDFIDPYTTGAYKYYTEEELRKAYSDWKNGSIAHSNAQNGNYDTFADTLVYKNGLVLNKKNLFGEYENFVSTAEQYFVMADFIDYAVKNNIEFYIKDSMDKSIDWDRVSSTVKISGTSYDPETGTIKIDYKDSNNLTGFGNDSYTLVLAPSGFNASSPIVDSIKSISELVNIMLDDSKQINAEEKLFKLLERVEGSTNVVKWKTETVTQNGLSFPVYNLKKKFRNAQTGAVESRTTVEVAQKESGGKYYILSKNSKGEYNYTNQTIEYNNGVNGLDELEPIYVYGSWTEKLYNDMKVIYKDINIDNFINYGTWADSLGEYFTTGEILGDDVTNFSTTLIHPLGLIMSELFLGTTFEDTEGVLLTNYSFASKYSKDLIQSICFAVSGEIRYKQLVNEIDSFVNLFNGLFTPILEDLQKIEGFDMNGNGEYSVQTYVYRAYLCSVLLTKSGTDYLNTLAETIYQLTGIINNIASGKKNYLVSESGNSIYEIEYSVDKFGKLIPRIKQFNSVNQTGKYVYNEGGERVLACDQFGVISTDSVDAIYMPKSGVLSSNIATINDLGQYAIYLISSSGGGKYYTRTEALKISEKMLNSWDEAFKTHFTIYYDIRFDGNSIATKEGESGVYVVNSVGQVGTEYNETYKYIPKSKDYIACEIDGKQAIYTLIEVSNDYKYIQVEYDGVVYKPEYKADGVTIDEKTSYGGRFDDFFEVARARAYVYMPTNLDTSKEKTIVSLVEAVSPTEENLFTSLYSVSSVNSNDNEARFDGVVGNAIKVAMKQFYLYEGTTSLKGENKYSTFNNLSKDTQNIIKSIIENSDEDTVYYSYIKAYMDGSITLTTNSSTEKIIIGMDDILSADTITTSEASEIESNLDSLKETIFEMYFGDRIFKNIIKYKSAYKKITSYYKYRVIDAFISYQSAKIQSGFTVVVNGNSYNVKQALSTRNYLELMYGNYLLYDSLSEQLANEVEYNNLIKFNQMALNNSIILTVQTDVKEARELKQKLQKYHIMAMMHSDARVRKHLTFTDREFELIENACYVLTGERLTINYKTLADAITLQDPEKEKTYIELYQKIITSLEKFSSFGVLIENYKASSPNFYEVVDSDRTGAYEMMARYINIIKANETLSINISEDYTGIIDKDGTFGYLKQFLKDFGNLCFDLQTKTNFPSLSFDTEDYIDLFVDIKDINGQSVGSFASQILSAINSLLSDVDFGTNRFSIDKFVGFYVKDEKENVPYKDLTFIDYTPKSQQDIYLLYNYFSALTSKYESIMQEASNAVGYLNKFVGNVYPIQKTSLVYSTFLVEYIDYFKHNVDISNSDFVKNYIYEDYYTEIDSSYNSNDDLSTGDITNYFFQYLEAFESFNFSANGNYFNSLTNIQKKVCEDALSYYTDIYNKTTEEKQEQYNKTKAYNNCLYDFIYNNKIAGECGNQDNGLDLSVTEEIKATMDMFRVLNFIGLDFDINKQLKDYRIDALNYLTEFSEYAGETSASIQSRYLALMYLACIDIEDDATGTKVIKSDNNTKQTILKLAGIENRAEQDLVDLEYEINYDKSKSDEKYGSVFIICTYNSETEKYEPFVMASGEDEHNTPYSEYLSGADDGSVKYYPVVAKGVIDINGRPTAIRSVNGNIEFYRQDVYAFDITNITLEQINASQEHTSGEYSLGDRIITNFKNVFSFTAIKDTISDIISFFRGDVNVGTYYGVYETTTYHLENGYCNLNYTFNPRTGIAIAYLYEYSQLNIIILIVASIVLLKAMTSVLYGLISSMFELAIMFAISPAVMSLNNINDKAIGKWKSNFLKKFFVMYGFIITINSYFILLTLVQKMGNVMPTISQSSERILSQTFIFRYVDVGKILGVLASTTVLLVITTMLKSLSDTFSKELLGSGDALGDGGKVKGAIKNQIQEAKYFNSGQQFKDMAADAVDSSLAMLPGVEGTKTVRDLVDAGKKQRNKRKADKLYSDMRANGISPAAAEQARKVYMDALNARVEESSNRANAELQSQRERIKNWQSTETKGKEKTCKWCHGKYEDPKGNVTNCPHCGRKVK